MLRSPEALAKARMVTPFHYNAPLMLLVSYDLNARCGRVRMTTCFITTTLGEQDASIAAATMMYEAEELGIHNVWLRGFDALTVSEVFELPENIVPVMIICYGLSFGKGKTQRMAL